MLLVLYFSRRFIRFILVIFNWVVGYKMGMLKGVSFYLNFVLNVILVLSLVNKQSLKLINKRFDKVMGEFSYPIYLVHFQVGLIGIIVLGAFGIKLDRPSYELMLFEVPLVFIVSWLLILLIERPIELVRQVVKRK